MATQSLWSDRCFTSPILPWKSAYSISVLRSLIWFTDLSLHPGTKDLTGESYFPRKKLFDKRMNGFNHRPLWFNVP